MKERVVLVCAAPVGGGLTYARQLSGALQSGGWSTTLVVPPSKTCADEPREPGVAHAAWNPFLDELRAAMQSSGVVAVHSVGLRSARAVYAAIPEPWVPHLFSSINFALQQCPTLSGRAERLAAYRRVCRKVTVTLANADMRQLRQLCPRGRLHYVPNGVPSLPATQASIPCDDVCYSHHSLTKTPPRDMLRVACAGRWETQKGIEHLIAAADHLAGSRDAVHVDIIGDGCLRDTLQRQAGKSAASIAFHGWGPHYRDLLARATVVAIPSLWEGLPYVLLEALGLGRPIVASKVNGMADILTSGRDCILVPPANAHAIASALARMSRDSSLREACGQGALKLAKRNSEARMFTTIKRIYRTVLVS